MYILFNVISLIINYILNFLYLNKTTIIKNDIFVILILECFGLIIGSKIFDIVINYKYYLNYNFYEIVTSGFMFYGGVLYAMFVVLIYCKQKKIETIDVFNSIVVNVLLLYSVCKLGCFFNHCCNGINAFPIQLVESAASFIVYIFLIKMEENKKIALSCLFFGIIRFVIFFFRYNISINSIVFNQFISIIFIIVGFYRIYRQKLITS